MPSSKIVSIDLNQKLNHTQYANKFFDTFWQAYPRKVGKKQARLAFIKACKTIDPTAIIEAAELFAEITSDKELQYIPHPSTWLNGERWEDDLDHVVGSAKNNTQRIADIISWDEAVLRLK